MTKERLGNWIRATGWPDVLEFALLAVLALALAQWTWIVLTPRAVATSAESALSGASAPEPRTFPSSGTFSVLARRASREQGATPASSFRLLGVVSPGTAGKGRAIFVTDGGARKVVNAGDALSAGVKLKEVHPDYVVVTRDGALERIALDRRAAAALPRQARRDAAR